MYAVLLIMFAPLVAPKPEVQVAYFVTVDLIVINRVRSITTEYGSWGRPKYKASEVWWISWWDIPYSPFPGAWWPQNKRQWIDRGWISGHQVQHFGRCSGGWIVESKDGVNIIAHELWFVDSPYDFEMKNRQTYKPVRRL